MFVRNKPKSQRCRKSLDSKLNVTQLRIMEFSALSRGLLCATKFKTHLGLRWALDPFYDALSLKIDEFYYLCIFLVLKIWPGYLKNFKKDPFRILSKVKICKNSTTQAILVQIYAGPWPQLSWKIIHLLA